MYYIYSDGACSGNNKLKNCVGGFGYVIIDIDKKVIVKTGGAAVEGTTNNRMELSAVIQGLQDLLNIKNGNVSEEKCAILTDSNYIVSNWDSYIEKWIKNNFINATGKKILNDDLWKLLFKITKKFKAVKFQWVKSHDKCKFNIMADKLATNYVSEYKRIQKCY